MGAELYDRATAERWCGLLKNLGLVEAVASREGVTSRTMRRVLTRWGLGKPSDYTGAGRPVAGADDGPPTARSRPEAAAAHSPARAQFDDAQAAELARFCRQPRTLQEACDHLNVWPARALEIAIRAQTLGHAVEFQGSRLTWTLPEERSEGEHRALVSPSIGGWNSFAVVGDVHFGSKYCRDDYLADFCRIAYDRGCRTFLQVGDMLDGEYRHGIRELRAHGFDEQADECIGKLPRLPGACWYFIDGNHDETFTKSAGIVAGRALVDRAVGSGRDDLVYLGQRRGLLRLDCGLPYQPLVELWHPLKSGAYALSYHLQKRCESYHPGTKPDILLAGHWHQFAYITERGIHALSTGTFQGGGSAFSNAIGTPQAIGATIVNFALAENGTLRQVSIERTSYYETETARKVRL